ncbi:MAG: Fur family transcriptional regulator [Chloroflexota bacterium]
MINNGTTEEQTRFEALIARLRDGGYRLTPQRVALVKLLAADDGHPSAAHLYDRISEQFPTSSPATVYKTLNLLKDLGEVLELGFSDDDNRYDGSRPYPHAHLICIRCHKIIDSDTSVASNLVEEVSQRLGFQLVSHRLDFYGLCPECRAAD